MKGARGRAPPETRSPGQEAASPENTTSSAPNNSRPSWSQPRRWELIREFAGAIGGGR
jgi:hypothetical protein